MINLVIANIIALIASIIMVYSGYLKKKKEILYAQTVQIGLGAISSLMLGGITGSLMSVISCIRNILCYKGKLDFKAKVIILVSSGVLTIAFNNIGIIGLLPLISTVAYIIWMNTTDVIKLKILIIVTSLLWGIHDLCIKSYTSACFNFMNVLMNIISMIQILKSNKE